MNRKSMVFLIVLLVLGVLLIATAGIVYFVSQSQKPPKIELPPSLDELAEKYPDLSRILENSELDTVYKEFLMVYEDEGEEAALDMARERGILVTNDGKEYFRLTLILDTEDTAPLQAELEEMGVVVSGAFRDQIEVAIPLDLVRQELATDDPGAIFHELSGMEHVVAVQLPIRTTPDGSTIEGEGVDVIDADVWQDAGITGAGLRIGVLDLGFAGYEDLLGEELPDSVTFEIFGSDFDDDTPMQLQVHGTACAEIIHEIAPDAELVFAMYDGSVFAFEEAADWLVSQDVDIISHSAGGVFDPRDGTGWMAQKVDEVSAEGILWVNAAGNEALSHHRGDFTDTDGNGWHEFPSGYESLAAQGPGYIQVGLIWDEEWDRATQDYQLYVYDEGGELLGSSLRPQSGETRQWPVEIVQVYSGGDIVYIAIVAESATRPVTFDIFVRGGRVDYPTAGYSVSSPADAASSLSVGAVNWSDDSLANYSSQGPTPDGRLKPEISAPTSVSGASYGGLGMPFTGTSAACPHVAGAAALVWQAYPDFTRQNVSLFLMDSAKDLGPSGVDTGFGYGRLELPVSSDLVVSPEPTKEPPPTDTPLPGTTSVPEPTEPPEPTLPPEPTFTPVEDYAVPTQVRVTPQGSASGSLAFATGLLVVIIGLGCGGVLLVFVGLIGVVVLVRRGRRARPRPMPMPMAPPPPMPRPGAYGYPPPAPAPPQQHPPAAQQQRGAALCPHCGAVVRPGAQFCAACGNSIIVAPQCPHCGASLREGVRFCSRCGRPVQ